jgi:hypothetical protein
MRAAATPTTTRTTAGSITLRAMALGAAILVGCALPAAAEEDESSSACEHVYAIELANCDAIPRGTEGFAFCMALAEVNYSICKGIEASASRMNASSPPGRNFTPVPVPVAGATGVRVPITVAPVWHPVRPIRVSGIPPVRRAYGGAPVWHPVRPIGVSGIPPVRRVYGGAPVTIYARGGGMGAGYGHR